MRGNLAIGHSLTALELLNPRGFSNVRFAFEPQVPKLTGTDIY